MSCRVGRRAPPRSQAGVPAFVQNYQSCSGDFPAVCSIGFPFPLTDVCPSNGVQARESWLCLWCPLASGDCVEPHCEKGLAGCTENMTQREDWNPPPDHPPVSFPDTRHLC